MRNSKSHVTLKQHLVQPFDIPFPGSGRVYLSSGFCESDESTTIFRRSVLEGESDVCEVECSLCGNPVITHRHSSLLSSTYSPEILGCVIQRNKTLLCVVERNLTPSDSKTVVDVLLQYLARHDFSASFQKINVYLSGVNSNLRRKQPPKSDLLFSQKLKFISEETNGQQPSEESQDQEKTLTQENQDRLRRKEQAKSAAKLLKELQKLSMPQKKGKEKTSSSLPLNLQKTSKSSQEKLSKAEGILFRKRIRKFVMKDSVYD